MNDKFLNSGEKQVKVFHRRSQLRKLLKSLSNVHTKKRNFFIHNCDDKKSSHVAIRCLDMSF